MITAARLKGTVGFIADLCCALRPLLKSSFLQAAAEVANRVDFALEDRKASLDIVLDYLKARFLSRQTPCWPSTSFSMPGKQELKRS